MITITLLKLEANSKSIHQKSAATLCRIQCYYGRRY